ncbi:MAG: glycosyltransferase family 2 protein [Sarcina sp.]
MDFSLLTIIISIVSAILFVISIYCSIIDTYYVFLSIFGFKNIKKKYYEDSAPQAKFLILVAAHNEEDVILSTLDNLAKIEYPKELYDLYVVNDNSVDKTGELCDSVNVKHIDTAEKLFEREGVGKSAGLQYALRYLGFEELIGKYDLLLILDADNHIDSNLLTEVNSQWIYENKPMAIQAYLDSKNSNSTIATGYTISYNIMNRFFQLSKKRLGLNNAIGGTGFSTRIDWLIKTNGFCYKSLVEDLEMSVKIFLEGNLVSWNHFVRIYDEKPDTLKISIKQRIRWCQGHWYVAFVNFWSLFKGIFTSKFKDKLKYIDQLMYLFSMGKSLQVLILLVSIIFTGVISILYISYFPYFKYLLFWFVPLNIYRTIMVLYSYIFLPIYANRVDGSEKLNPFRIIWGILVVGWTYLYPQIVGLFKCKNQSVWIKTPHKHQKIDKKP